MDYEINFHFLVSKELGVTLDSLAWSFGSPISCPRNHVSLGYLHFASETAIHSRKDLAFL